MTWCTNFDCCSEDRYIGIFLIPSFSQAEVKGSNPCQR
jgi:hypothetical protein